MREPHQYVIKRRTRTNELRDIVVPCIHLNGSGRDRLLKQCTDAMEAARALQAALCEMGPNGRDYYPIGAALYESARTQHFARLEAIDTLLLDLEYQVAAIDDDTFMGDAAEERE